MGTDPLADVGVEGIRRLSRVEMDATIKDLTGDTGQGAQQLITPDPTNPFDNDFQQQLASSALVEAIERIATEVAERLLADATRYQTLVGCTPNGANDGACLAKFIQTFGRRALRRPLTDQELTDFLNLGQPYAVEANDFSVGVKLVVMAMLQEPEFVYRIEIGTPVAGHDGVQKLSAYQLAARLSYFLWGSTPPDWLLDAAAQGQLDTKDGLRITAAKLLQSPRAQANVERYHALWLSYWRLPHSVDLTTAMQAESAALVDKVVFQTQGDYFDLFRADSTYLNQTLATHYGMPWPAGATGTVWMPYGSAPRKGLLSHGSVLSAGAKFADTSPTQRGIFIRTRLFCQDIPPPPPGVNVDQAPTSTTSNCKVDRYAAHSSNGTCHSCHQNLDPVGFGIENFNKAGQWRDHDDNEPSCPISGDGSLTGLPNGTQTFKGVVGLTDLMLNSGQMEQCTVKQVFRFAMGRKETGGDGHLLERLTGSFKDSTRSFQGLLVDLVTDDSFSYRRDE